MGGLGHQRHALGDHVVCDLADDRPKRSPRYKFERPEQMGGAIRHRGLKLRLGQSGKAHRLGRALHPHDR